MSIEHDLRRALRRKQPPNGFSSRVRARLAGESTSRSDDGRSRRSDGGVRWVAVAAVVLLIAGGASEYRKQQVRRQTAKSEVMAALGIASEKLQLVRQIVRDHN